MKILYIGGTGTISSSCVAESLREDHEVWVLNRKQSTRRPLPAQVKVLQGDVTDRKFLEKLFSENTFDVVIDFLSFTAVDAQKMVEVLSGKVRQYIHISSASIYQKPVKRVPVTESTPVYNHFLVYSQDKIAGEQVLIKAYLEHGFPVTIVRPSHTYDDAMPPLMGDWTTWMRMIAGTPTVVHGDGTSLWTVTHASDLAVGLVGLIGNSPAIGETFHITSDEAHTWNEIFSTIGMAQGIKPTLLHMASDLYPIINPDWFWSHLVVGDLSHSAVFDNSKIRNFVPKFNPIVTWSEGAQRCQKWFEKNKSSVVADAQTTQMLDRILAAQKKTVASVSQ